MPHRYRRRWLVTDDGFDTTTNDEGKHRWVFNGPGGSQHHGPTWHKSRAAAIRAGRKWLAERKGAVSSDT
jgi:hypothetical protein